MDNSYRIKANVGIDQVLNVNLKQDIDIYEVLSLKLTQENLYKLHSADYGVIVGRVLANDAFGVPNAKVTVFIPLSDVDKLRQGIRDIYPYDFVTDVDNRKVKFNALPNYKKFACHQEVGSFPKKQLVLDEDTVLEVYDKYYKYTTITNKAGDYMIFGVPTGEQILHVDVDLSDIGIISQEPRDFIYKGYSIDLFESPTQFKKSTNLDDLPQIQNQNASVSVYPLWGDKNTNEIAITRKDINLQYKFETTCVFLGSVITDNGPNSISHNCIPDANVGEAGQMSPSKGNIEMIRKTVDDRVEEYPIKGNQLIDGDGTWCYQIPMNLDYVGMDEYGNIIPTNNPNKGIPTRARVRFRFTLDETGEDDLTRHKARYLVPNNPDLYEGYVEPHIHEDILDKDLYYEFGTLTPDDCFRDLYWNKVYSVKNYIPRIQMSKHEKSANYLAIKGVNKKDAMKNNPIPYNKLNLNISIPAYFLLYRYGIGDKGVGGFWRFLKTYSIPYNVDNVREAIIEELDGIGLDFYNDWLNGCLYFPSWFWHIRQKKRYKKGESEYDSVFCECKNKEEDTLQSQMFLFNNCSLVYENDDMIIKTHNSVIDDYLYSTFYDLYTSIPFGTKQFYSGIIKKKTNKDGAEAFYYTFGNKLKNRKENNNDEFDATFPEEIRPEKGAHYYKYARLYSTDIILLGSLKDCDIDGVPKVGYTMPSTTSNIPPIGRYKPQTENIDGDTKDQMPDYDAEDSEEYLVSHNGMNWGAHWRAERGFFQQMLYDAMAALKGTPSAYKYYLGSGLFFGLSSYKVYEGADWVKAGVFLLSGLVGGFLDAIFGSKDLKRVDIVPYSDIKTCINAERISELGVTLDSEVNIEYDDIGGSTGYSFVSEMDGLITKREIEDVDSRALFATLNFNKLIGTAENYITGYKKYDLKYFYPTNFDGRMGDEIKILEKTNRDYGVITAISEYYTDGVTTDDRNKDYLDFRFGNREERYNQNYRSLSIGFDGKQQWIDPNKQTNLGKKTVNTHNGEYNEYVVGNGYVQMKRFYKPKNRHFYGYKNNEDKVYPLVKNYVKLEDYPYSFPLYDNSFYFYFGMNQGSTAIDKFYEKFYSECPDVNAMPFMMKVSVTGSTVCGSKNGSIRTDVQEINLPYTIRLYENNELIEEVENVNLYVHSFNGLSNGNYTIEVEDMYGTKLSEEVFLTYQKISLETNLVRAVLTDYIGQSCLDICGNDYHGKLSIDTYMLYGTQYNVNLGSRSVGPNGEGVYQIGTYNGNRVMIDIISNNGDAFADYVCTCTTEKEGNIINFNKPGVFTIKAYEMCGNEVSENISYYTVTIPDTKRLEMYVNNVPLKYIVGYNEDLIPYNPLFHNSGETVTCVTDISIKGWFGTHDPKTYHELFQKPLKDNINKLLWLVDIGDSGNLDILREKFNFMFALSSGAYVVAGGHNAFVVRVDGAQGEILLRSGMPEYDKFNFFNTDKKEEFSSYLTSRHDTALCNEFNANIVSENYRYVNNDNERFPEACDGIIGEIPILPPSCAGGECHYGYDFNPKYKDYINKAANYFAGFSNNANIVQTSPENCEQRNDYEPYQVIPYKAADLFNEGMCLYNEQNNILSPIYDPQPDDKGEHRRYFRTEFIDRRFDYNAFFITGHRGIHYDINYPEENENVIRYGNGGTIWDKGRISALTYNGIDMLYKDVNGKKMIISDTSDTEYKYNLSDATIELNMDAAKRFYDSKLYYGDGKYVDLLQAFYYINNTGARAFYLDKDGNEVDCTMNENPIPAPEFKNFGLVGKTVQGYPSKRWVDYYRVPYGDKYTFYNVSCGYEGIRVEETNQQIKAVAVPSETVTFNIEACELITFLCNDFESDCKAGHYNIKYWGASEGTCTSKKIVDLPFKIDTTGSTGFRTKVEKLGIRVCWDVEGHNNLIAIKSAPTFDACTGKVDSTTIFPVIGSPDVFDTEEEFKNKTFNGGGRDLKPEYQFINMIFDRMYYSQAADSLMKRIRVLNTSTIYNVSDFEFYYTDHKIVSDEFVIKAGDISISAETDGDVTADTPSNSGEESGGNTNNGESGGSVHSTGTGSNTNDVESKKRHDYTEFTFISKFIANCMGRFCAKITLGDITALYTLYENSVGIIQRDKDEGIVKIGIIWSQHKNLLREVNGPAKVTIYMNIENEIKGKEDKAHMEFAFAFEMTESAIINDIEPQDGGMTVIDDDDQQEPDDQGGNNN